MQLLKLFFLAVALLSGGLAFGAQTSNPESIKDWKASWIMPDGFSPYDFGVYYFRKTFNIDKKPQEFVINISADNRYILYVNGKLAARGPARGDVRNWYFDTIDIAQLLNDGKNVLAVCVWNSGAARPYNQISLYTCLLVGGASAQSAPVNTPAGWKAVRAEAYSPIVITRIPYVGFTEDIDASKYLWGWEGSAYDDSAWSSKMRTYRRVTGYGGTAHGEYDRLLMPRDIPFMLERPEHTLKVRASKDVEAPLAGEGAKISFTVQPNTKCEILFDNKVLTNAFVRLLTSGGKGSKITLYYAEGLYAPDSKNYRGGKGNRDEIDGKAVLEDFSVYNVFRPDGGKERLFETLDYRTYRYVLMKIETAAEALEINDFYGIYTSYPFEQKAKFESDDHSLKAIWDTGWRTALLCAYETYMDCPYYERLQYVGDTRIQAFISLYVSGDDRLMRKAIKLYHSSIQDDGLCMSRYPTSTAQIIPPFALYWVNMIKDYALLRGDSDFIKEYLNGIRGVLSWFEDRIDPSTGMLRADLPCWNFVDWTGWERGNGPVDLKTGAGSSIITLHFALTLQDAADIMRDYGFEPEAKRYEALSEKIKKAVYAACWDKERGMLSDYKGSVKHFSQHANIMGILSDAIPQADQKDVFEKIYADKSIAQASYYYRFYLTRAMLKVGLGDMYADSLTPWSDMLKVGLSTFAEGPEPVRSDCHAWSASPNYEFLATICGMTPDEEGFKRVRIEPHLGRLNFVKASMPHPAGEITIELRRDGLGLQGEITLPQNLEGVFRWHGKELFLKSGKTLIDF